MRQLSSRCYFEKPIFCHLFLNRWTFANSLSHTLTISTSTFRNVHFLEGKTEFSMKVTVYQSTFSEKCTVREKCKHLGKWVSCFARLRTYPAVRHPGVFHCAVLNKSYCVEP